MPVDWTEALGETAGAAWLSVGGGAGVCVLRPLGWATGVWGDGCAETGHA